MEWLCLVIYHLNCGICHDNGLIEMNLRQLCSHRTSINNNDSLYEKYAFVSLSLITFTIGKIDRPKTSKSKKERER